MPGQIRARTRPGGCPAPVHGHRIVWWSRVRVLRVREREREREREKGKWRVPLDPCGVEEAMMLASGELLAGR